VKEEMMMMKLLAAITSTFSYECSY
jgi:hypothetical protein